VTVRNEKKKQNDAITPENKHKTETSEPVTHPAMNKKSQTCPNRRAAVAQPTNAKNNASVWLRRLLATAAVGGLALLALHLIPAAKPVPPAAPDQTPGPVATPSRPAPPPTAAPSLGLRKGDRLVYQFQQERSVEIQASSFGGMISKGATNQSVTAQTTQAGDFVVNVYEENAQGWTVGFSVEHATVKMSAGDKTAPSDGSEAGLRAEVLALVEKCGRISKMTAQSGTSPETLSQWRDILSRWQTVLAPHAGERTWEQTEEDATGRYVAAYARQSDQLPTMVRKQKQKYLKVFGAKAKGFESRSQITNLIQIQLAPYPTRIEGYEQLVLQTPEIGGKVVSEADFFFHLRTATRPPEVESRSSAMARYLELSPAAFSWETTNAPSHANQLVDVSNTTIEEQIASLEELLAAGKEGTSAELRILEKIVALIRKSDAAVDTIVSHLRNPAAANNPGLASALVGMLGAAGTPKAQSTLIAMANTAQWPQEQRQMAIFAFAQVTDPIPQVDGWLRQLHQEKGEFANNSLLVLAAMGDRVREQDPARFRQITDYVVSAASAPDLDLNGRVVALDALGNLGPQEIPQVVRAALASDDPMLREKALTSLKRVPDESVDGVLSQALSSDAAASVRAAAANLLGDTRWNSGFENLSKAAVNDSSEEVRTAAVRSLTEWRESRPEVNQVLQQVASHDASEDVRKAAAQALRNGGGFEADDAPAAGQADGSGNP
jgi:hypothetical protein